MFYIGNAISLFPVDLTVTANVAFGSEDLVMVDNTFTGIFPGEFIIYILT